MVASTDWHDDGGVIAGAVTWRPGGTSSPATVSSANSLTGAAANDGVGYGVTALANGNYVVGARGWDNGATLNVGAVTWGSGSGGLTGVVAASNSLMVGSTPGDRVGEVVVATPDGNFVVPARFWDNGALADTGIVAWGNGNATTASVLSPSNGLTGAAAGDAGAALYVAVLPDSSVLIYFNGFDNGTVTNAGLLTHRFRASLVGSVTAGGAVIGTGPTDTPVLTGRYTSTHSIVIGRPLANTVSILQTPEFVSLNPARLADTRAGFATIDNIDAGTGQLAAGATLDLQVTGRGGVGADAGAVVLNVTAVGVVANGFVTVYPCGSPRPTASSLNTVVGVVTPNAVLTKLGAAGHVCLFTLQPTDLVIDVNGYFPESSSYSSINPTRLLDTRADGPTADNQQQGAGAVSAMSVTELNVAGRAGLPAGVGTVALNVTVTNPSLPGFLTVYPCGLPRPTASSLNYSAGSTVANLVVSKVSPAGTVCIFAQTPTDLVVDIDGYFPNRTAFVSLVPARLLETRSGLTTVDGFANNAGLRAAGGITPLLVFGRGGVPADATTVVLNVTVTEPIGPGFVTVFPCGIDPPLASNLNYASGSTVANAVLVKVGSGGSLCFLSSQATHLVVDVVGYLAG